MKICPGHTTKWRKWFFFFWTVCDDCKCRFIFEWGLKRKSWCDIGWWVHDYKCGNCSREVTGDWRL